MTQAIATFEKVSFEEYISAQHNLEQIDRNAPDFKKHIDVLKKEWEDIVLPTRATPGSAGYDFHIPYHVVFTTDKSVQVATGVRVKIEPGWMLALFPRSGLGFKKGMRLKNTVGIIDSDYYNAANEGHIMAKVDTDQAFAAIKGDRFMQGVFIPYGLTTNDTPAAHERLGGMGSTGMQ